MSNLVKGKASSTFWIRAGTPPGAPGGEVHSSTHRACTAKAVIPMLVRASSSSEWETRTLRTAGVPCTLQRECPAARHRWLSQPWHTAIATAGRRRRHLLLGRSLVAVPTCAWTRVLVPRQTQLVRRGRTGCFTSRPKVGLCEIYDTVISVGIWIQVMPPNTHTSRV